MFLAEPPRTPYDFQFQIFGFPVRVTPFFWLVMAILGYNFAVGLNDELQKESPGVGVLLLIWIAATFFSILIHELGHAFAMRHYGMRAYIVLYQFGGLAVPDTVSSFFHTNRYRGSTDQIVISIAGPAVQLLLAIIVIMGVRFSGHEFSYAIWPIDELLPPSRGRPFPSALLETTLFFLVLPSVYWALFNLLPIFPLDGGQISRELFTMFTGANGFRDSLILSIVTAASVAAYFYSTGNIFNALFVVTLGVSNYQLLQMLRFGGGSW